MRTSKEVKKGVYPTTRKELREGIFIYRCTREKKNLKTGRVRMSPEARRLFRLIHPANKASLCETRKRGPTQKRVREGGQTIQGARSRVPWRMAAHISVVLKQAWENVNAGAGNQRNRSGWGIIL